MEELAVLKTDIEWYMNNINSLPVLSAEESHKLAENVYNQNCIESAKKLITHNLKLVVRIAYTYKGYNLPMIDLIQEGSIGLMIAVKKYDPYREIKLSTYAANWIHSYIRKFIMDNYSLVKLGTNEDSKKVFWSGGYDTDETLNVPVISKDGTSSIDKLYSIKSNLPSPEEICLSIQEQDNLKDDIKQALSKLTEKQQLVAYYRFFSEESLTLRDIAKLLNISPERVRQLEVCVINNLKKYLEGNYK